jgi:hypothetical protein
MSKGLLRNKMPELRLALEGRVTEHHRFLLRQLYDHLCFTESKSQQIEEEIDRRMGPFEDKVQLWVQLRELESDRRSLAATGGRGNGPSQGQTEKSEYREGYHEDDHASSLLQALLGHALGQMNALRIQSLTRELKSAW